MSAEPGQLLPVGHKEGRDAIHVQTVPVTAVQVLKPGQRIKRHLPSSSIVYVMEAGKDDAIGIVDPFLIEDVKHCEQFLMFMLPGTTKALRHDWTHPAFPEPPKVSRFVEDDWGGGECSGRGC